MPDSLDLFSIPQYEERARELVSVPAWQYYDQGCADDLTVRWSREALQRLRFESRVMVDVETIDTSTTLFGRALQHPILLAPAAAHMLVHPEGEVATARGASAASAIMVLSTNANCAVEAVAAAATQPLWFQLYVNRDRGIAKDLIQRVESAGCQALCVTVDQPVIYARDRLSRQSEMLRALPRVADRVARRIPVLMDGGIRRGGDVLKALAHGASAVLIGRPYLYGLAVNGSAGVQHIVEILRRELEGAMALTGRTTIARIDRTALWPETR